MIRPASPARRLAIVLGDTAGHVYPALAIADAWRQRAGAVEVLLIGPRNARAVALAEEAGYGVSLVNARPIARADMAGKAAALIEVGRTARESRTLLAARGVRLVIGLGSFASGGVLLAARTLGLRTAIHESNVVPGLANRLLARVVHRIYLGFDTPARWCPASRRLVTGNPVRASVAALIAEPRTPPAGRTVRMLVLGATRGSSFLGQAAPSFLRLLSEGGLRLQVRHQSGKEDVRHILNMYQTAGIDAEVAPFFPDIANDYRWADFAIARAGGGTLAELAVAGLPSLLVPLADAAANHQETNAQSFAAGGAALWAREMDWNEAKLGERVTHLFRDPSAWSGMSAAARRLAASDAAATIVEDAERMMADRW